MVLRRRGPKRSLHETSYERVLQDEKPLRLTAKLLGLDQTGMLYSGHPEFLQGALFLGRKRRDSRACDTNMLARLSSIFGESARLDAYAEHIKMKGCKQPRFIGGSSPSCVIRGRRDRSASVQLRDRG